MLHTALLAISLQLHISALPAYPGGRRADSAPDSVRELNHAKSSQTAFERFRKSALPTGYGSAGRCDVRLGRFCWWYDGDAISFPPERDIIISRRKELLHELDLAARHFPGDEWLQGVRVHYRIESGDFAQADTAVTECRASAWWCSALAGYVSHSRGESGRARDAFATAFADMPADAACEWSSIATLLRERERDFYGHLPCGEQRRVLEARFWQLSMPQLATGANDFRNEFYVRRVLTWLGANATTPHLMSWGDDAAELILRYGWPVAWSRRETGNIGLASADAGVIGHDPSPSFAFTPERWLEDSAKALNSSAWSYDDSHSESRFRPRNVRRVITAAAQFARFRRGDSTLVVSMYSAQHDSLRSAASFAGGISAGDSVYGVAGPAANNGSVQFVMPRGGLVVGVDVTDSSTGTLARARETFLPQSDLLRISISDLLFYRAGDNAAESLDSALVHAVAGDTVTRNNPIGLFWETYGLLPDGEVLDVAVSVERLDHSWIRGARQKLGLTPVDTPIRIRWSDARPPTAQGAAHALSLDLGNLEKGRYKVTLSLTPTSGETVASTKEMELIDP